MADHLSERDDLALRTLAFIERTNRSRAAAPGATRVRRPGPPGQERSRDREADARLTAGAAERRRQRDQVGEDVFTGVCTHIALPGGPGDFTPYEAPEYVEEKLSPLGELVEHLAEVLGMDYVRVIADCGMEAGG
jgi:hypothetical protein